MRSRKFDPIIIGYFSRLSEKKVMYLQIRKLKLKEFKQNKTKNLPINENL